MAPAWEDGSTIEKGEGGGRETMFGRKAEPVAFVKAASERRREDNDQRGAYWSTEETPWR